MIDWRSWTIWLWFARKIVVALTDQFMKLVEPIRNPICAALWRYRTVSGLIQPGRLRARHFVLHEKLMQVSFHELQAVPAPSQIKAFRY